MYCFLWCAIVVCISMTSQIAATQSIDDTPRPSCTGSSSVATVNHPNPQQLFKWTATDFSMNCLGTVIADTSGSLKNWCTNMTANNLSITSTSGAVVYLQTGTGSNTTSYPLALMAGSVTQLSYQFDSNVEVSLYVVAPALEHLSGCSVGFKLDGTLQYSSASSPRSNVRPFLVHSTDNIIIESDEVTFYFAVPYSTNGTFEGVAAVVPTTASCGSDAGTAFDSQTANLTSITTLPVVSWSHTFSAGGRYSLCTQIDGQSWAVAGTVVVYGNPAYFIIHGSDGDAVIMYQVYTINFVGEYLDLRPQGDRFKLVSVLDGCSESSPAAGGLQEQSDLGPDDSHLNVSHSTAQLQISVPGAFLVCYYIKSENRWATVENYNTLPHEASDYLPTAPSVLTTTTAPATAVSNSPLTSIISTTSPNGACTDVVNCPLITTPNPLLVLTLDSVFQYNVENSLAFRRSMDSLLCAGNETTPSSVIWEVRTEGGQSSIVLGYSCGTCITSLSLSSLKCKLEEGIANRKFISNVIGVYVVASTGVTTDSTAQGSSSTNPDTADIMIISGVVAGILLLGLILGGTVYFFVRAGPPRQGRRIQTGALDQDNYQDIHPADGDIPVGVEMAEVEDVSDFEREPEWGQGAAYQPNALNMGPADFAAEKRAAAEASRLAANDTVGNTTSTPTLTSSKSSADNLDSMNAGPLVYSPTQEGETFHKSEELESYAA